MPVLFVPVLRRAFASNPRLVRPNPHEAAKLTAAGVHQPVLQSYLAWRRGLMLFTLVAAIFSTGLSTWREYSGSDERPDLFSKVSESVENAIDENLPAPEDKDEQEDEEETPAATAAADPEEEQPTSTLGKLVDFVSLAALYALQFAALAALLVWSRWRLSFAIMAVAFGFSFIVPLLVALCPWSWWGYVEHTYSFDREPLEYLMSTGEGLLEGAGALVSLLPTVLSLVPAVQRACVRVKMLLPQAMLPGWFLVMASPFYALFLLVIFVALNQVDSSPLLIVGFLLFLAAPLIYPLKASFYTRPLASDEDYQRIRNVQRVVGVLTAAAGACFLVFLSTQKVLGAALVGTDPEHALIVPLDLVEFGLEVLSRSMFVTALGADLFMRMNLAAWQNTRSFAESGQAENYDRVMGELETIS